MRCTKPRTVGFKTDGKTISWSSKKCSKEYATFQLPCGKCIECRLEYARQWAVRSVHESKMYEQNSFITLTYDDLKDTRLQYRDFQLFVKRLRSHIRSEVRKKIGKINWRLLTESEKKEHYEKNSIGIFVTGEYGGPPKPLPGGRMSEGFRPHWHAILFNFSPPDGVYKYSNDRGDKIYSSEILSRLWGHGTSEFGSVTFESAGYVARYAAKKLVHGHDEDHDYEPISKKSSKHAIGKKWLEQFWPDVFNYGYIILPDGKQCSIPRYYEKWLAKNHPTEYTRYVTETKQRKVESATARAEAENDDVLKTHDQRIAAGNYNPATTKQEARTRIIESKFKQLQSKLKL